MNTSSPFHQTEDMKRRLFPPYVVAPLCRIPHTAAGLRLAWRKNPSVSFVPVLVERTTRLMKLIAVAAASVAVLGGCASSMSGGAYSREQARQVQEVKMGVVESVRQVKIEGTKSPVGVGAGAVIGGIAGSNVGQGKGSNVGAILGAVAGGVAGSMIEEGVTSKNGLEITVKLDNGHMIAVTQEADEQFKVGERIRVLSGGGVTRVTH